MRRYIHVLVLFALSPFIAEILFGATPLSNLDSFAVVAPLYGAGALLIREVVRRRGGGWGRIALLGAAYGIIEEGVALQSLFNPDLFNAGSYGGHAFGVNWVWTEWTIGYHVVWSITLPILLAELLFPDRRAVPWLGRIGLTIVGVLYVIAAAAHIVIFRLFVAPDFRTPLHLMISAVVVVIGLIALALGLKPPTGESLPNVVPIHDAPSPWLVGLVTLAASGLWFVLLGLPMALRTGIVVLVPLLLALALAAGMITLLRKWSAPNRHWTDLHRLAIVMGALLTDMLMGYFRITAGDPTNQMFQGIVSLIALTLLVLFAFHVYRREQLHPVHVHQG